MAPEAQPQLLEISDSNEVSKRLARKVATSYGKGRPVEMKNWPNFGLSEWKAG
jgi:hypothetical protein